MDLNVDPTTTHVVGRPHRDARGQRAGRPEAGGRRPDRHACRWRCAASARPTSRRCAPSRSATFARQPPGARSVVPGRHAPRSDARADGASGPERAAARRDDRRDPHAFDHRRPRRHLNSASTSPLSGTGRAREPRPGPPAERSNQMKRLLALTASRCDGAAVRSPARRRPRSSQDPSGGQTIVVPKDKSAAFRLDYPVSEIVVAQPDTLSLVATTDRSFYVRGKALGVTNILIYDAQHHLAQVVDVRVGYDVDSLQADLDTALPGEHIRVANFAGGILLTGEVSTTAVAARAEEIAERYAPKDGRHRAHRRPGPAGAGRRAHHRGLALGAEGPRLQPQRPEPELAASRSPAAPALTSGHRRRPPSGVSGKFGAWDDRRQPRRRWSRRASSATLARPNLIAMSGQEAELPRRRRVPGADPERQTGVTPSSSASSA